MNDEIEGVVPPWVHTADRVTDGERQLQDRTGTAGHRIPRRPELADLCVIDDSGLVVEKEHPVEAVVIRGESRTDEQ